MIKNDDDEDQVGREGVADCKYRAGVIIIVVVFFFIDVDFRTVYPCKEIRLAIEILSHAFRIHRERRKSSDMPSNMRCFIQLLLLHRFLDTYTYFSVF